MKNFTKIAAAVSLALAAGNAFAALTVTSTADNLGPQISSVLFAAEDLNKTSTNYLHTFYYDLALGDAGLNYASFVNGTQGTGGTLSWDLSKVTQFSSYAADTSKLTWSIVGGSQLDGNNFTNLDKTGANAPFAAGAVQYGALVTGHQGAPDFSASQADLVQALGTTGAIGSWIASANTPIGTGANVADQAAFNATTSFYQKNLSGLGSLAAGGTTAPNTTGANSAGFYYVTSPDVTSNITQQLGTFSLSGGNVLTFTNVSPSPVPVPAAVWLFGSALLGMLGFNRRDNAKGLAA